jgi:hypothetical protein
MPRKINSATMANIHLVSTTHLQPHNMFGATTPVQEVTSSCTACRSTKSHIMDLVTAWVGDTGRPSNPKWQRAKMITLKQNDGQRACPDKENDPNSRFA